MVDRQRKEDNMERTAMLSKPPVWKSLPCNRDSLEGSLARFREDDQQQSARACLFLLQ